MLDELTKPVRSVAFLDRVLDGLGFFGAEEILGEPPVIGAVLDFPFMGDLIGESANDVLGRTPPTF